MQKFEVILEWQTPKVRVFLEIDGLSVNQILEKVKKEAFLPFETISFISIKTIE